MRLLRLLNRLFHGPAWLTFLAMGVALGGFALCSLDLFELFHVNFRLLATYGVMAALDGGLLQLVELIAWGYLALAFYVVFKGCLDGLLHRIDRSGGWNRPPSNSG
jgi:hypothetical protein